MRKRLVDSYTDPATGIKYGLRGDPLDFALSQQYTHDHVNRVVRDFLSQGQAAPIVAGFDRTLAGGLSLSIAAGRAYDAAGVFYETITEPAAQPAVVALEAADATHPRIDLVYVLLEPSVQALPIPRTFRRILSEAELAAHQQPYLPENFTRFSEEHAQASVRVRKGTPAAVPVAPAVQANEAPLFEVRVNAGAVTLVAGNVTDRRNRTRSLAEAWAQIDSNSAALQEANFKEAVQDALLTFFPDASPFDWTVNDAGNLVALDIAVATGALKGLMSAADKLKLDGVEAGATANATDAQLRDRATHTGAQAISTVTGLQAALDGKSAVGHAHADATSGASGFMPAADKAKLDAATSANTANALVRRDANGDIVLRRIDFNGRVKGNIGTTDVYDNASFYASMSNGNGSKGVQGHAEAGSTNGDTAYGGYFSSNANQSGGATGTTSYGVYATTTGGTPGTRWAGYFQGNVNITGSIAKGSGTFHIDHPVDPDNFDLVYGFCESPEYLNLYRVRARLAGGQVTVDLDEYFGHMGGTFQAANQDADVWGVMPIGPGGGQVSASEIAGGRFTLTSTDPGDSREVRVLIFAARADRMIRVNQHVDAEGRLISQQPKPALTPEDVEKLTPRTVFADGEPGGEMTVETRLEVLPDLVGKQGFRRNPEAFGQGLPAVEVTTITVPAPEVATGA